MWRLVAGIGGSLASLLGFKNLEYKIAKIVGTVVVIVGLIAILGLGKCAYDKSVVNEYKTEQRAVDAEAAVEADKIADDNERDRIEVMEEDNARLTKAAEEAERQDPVAAAKSVGPVSQSYYDNLPKKRGENR